jgi:hypothetical protein
MPEESTKEREAQEKERQAREREQREREERTREQQEQGQDPAGVRQQRVGLASGQANYVTPEEEDASEEAALERQEAVKEWAEVGHGDDRPGRPVSGPGSPAGRHADRAREGATECAQESVHDGRDG